MEVLDVDVLVGGGLPLAPEEEPLLGRHLLDGDVLDGEAEDDGPDHAQRHLDVAVHDLLGADRHQLHALRSDEVQRLNEADRICFKLQVCLLVNGLG